MPSVPLELGKYVTLRPRKDGTARVFFQVPERLRPSGWPSLTPLPFTGPRRGDLTDADEVGRIQADAAALYQRLLAGRGGETVEAQRRDLRTLNRLWQASQHFKDKTPVTQRGYAYHAGLLLDWSELLGHPLVRDITHARIETLLAAYDDRPTTRRHLKIVLKMLLDHAIKLEWVEVNRAAVFKMKAPKTKAAIWEQADVDFYAGKAVEDGELCAAALIRTEWEIGQRLTDARLFMHGKDYIDGAFRFWSSKTDTWITVPVSAELAALIEDLRDPDSPYLFRRKVTKRRRQIAAPFTESQLGHYFLDLKARTGTLARRLTIRSLRHSCVVQLARNEVDIPGICAITGHSPFSAAQILKVYLPRDNVLAWQAQQKRGLIAVNAAKTEV